MYYPEKQQSNPLRAQVSLGTVQEFAAQQPSRSVVCPHCKKPFTAELLHGAAQRYSGFKCPHCKLFVPAERTGSG